MRYKQKQTDKAVLLGAGSFDVSKLELGSMSALVGYLCSSIKNFGRIALEDFEFLTGAKIAFPGAAFVGARFALYFPSNFDVFFFIFQIPNILGQFCGRTLLDLIKTIFMVGVSQLEFRFGASDILPGIGIFARFSCGFINDSGRTTFTVQRARLAAVARFRLVTIGLAEGFVVTSYNGFHVRSRAGFT